MMKKELTMKKPTLGARILRQLKRAACAVFGHRRPVPMSNLGTVCPCCGRWSECYVLGPEEFGPDSWVHKADRDRAEAAGREGRAIWRR
jgi:hypothetical protein